ncbi:hypothetical protein ACOSQ3_016943 [Xanthoceras sorbifolium]
MNTGVPENFTPYGEKTDGRFYGKLRVKPIDMKIDALIGFKMVNMNIYLMCPNPELTIGVRRHSDMGALTVLLQDATGGLYMKL